MPKVQDPDGTKRHPLNPAKYAILTKRLTSSRLGTIRSGVDNRFRRIKTVDPFLKK